MSLGLDCRGQSTSRRKSFVDCASSLISSHMVSFGPDTRFARNPDLIATDMDGDMVMMSIERGEYFGIGGVGPRVWDLLSHPVSLADIVAAICVEFEVEETTCEADMRAFVDKLLQHKLIRASG